jgi:hypothetical protein
LELASPSTPPSAAVAKRIFGLAFPRYALAVPLVIGVAAPNRTVRSAQLSVSAALPPAFDGGAGGRVLGRVEMVRGSPLRRIADYRAMAKSGIGPAAERNGWLVSICEPGWTPRPIRSALVGHVTQSALANGRNKPGAGVVAGKWR